MPYRFVLFALALCVPCNVARVSAAGFTQGRAQPPFTALKPGDYLWKPEPSPAEPVVIIVSIPDQTLYVYRNGLRIGRSTASTGMAATRPPRACLPSCKNKSIMSQTSTRAPKCRTCSG